MLRLTNFIELVHALWILNAHHPQFLQVLNAFRLIFSAYANEDIALC